MEFIFKIFLTGLVIFFCFGSMKWIWFSQIDVKETGRQLLDVPKKSMDWVVTRDDNKIYQEGNIVGSICGEVNELEDKIIFEEISDTEQLNNKYPFEYKRNKLKIVSIGARSGAKNVVTLEGSISRKAVITNVICEKYN